MKENNKMRSIKIDGTMLCDKIQTMNYIAELFGFAEYFGMNLDALYDCLNDICEPTYIVINNIDAIIQNLGNYGDKLLMVIKDATEVNNMLQLCTDSK